MRLVAFIFFFSHLACNMPGSTSNSKQAKTDTGFIKANTAMFSKVDSLQVLYYNDPYGDSLRYSRYFTFVSLSTSEFIAALNQNMQKPVEQLAAVKPCRSMGKIYCYTKGEVLKTVYYNNTNKSCPAFLYFIDNGTFNYVEMNETLQQLLNSYRQKAVAPVS